MNTLHSCFPFLHVKLKYADVLSIKIGKYIDILIKYNIFSFEIDKLNGNFSQTTWHFRKFTLIFLVDHQMMIKVHSYQI